MKIERDNVQPGAVYLLSNDSMPGLVKVGMTRIGPRNRAASLSLATGVPTPFVLLGYFDVPFPDVAEAACHILLDACRVSRRREFFRRHPVDAWLLMGDALRRIGMDGAAFVSPYLRRMLDERDATQRRDLMAAARDGWRLPEAVRRSGGRQMILGV